MEKKDAVDVMTVVYLTVIVIITLAIWLASVTEEKPAATRSPTEDAPSMQMERTAGCQPYIG